MIGTLKYGALATGILVLAVSSVPNTSVIDVPEKDTRNMEIVALVESLAFCESSNRPDVTILDTNGLHSRGVMQFQYPTFKQYVRKYNLLEHVEDAELIYWMHEAEFSMHLAYLMLEENPDNWMHWYNCSRKTGVDVKVYRA